MICHYCCRGYIADGFDVRPCPECGGSGFIHCCEGERPDQCPKREAAPEPASSDQRREEGGASGDAESRSSANTVNRALSVIPTLLTKLCGGRANLPSTT